MEENKKMERLEQGFETGKNVTKKVLVLGGQVMAVGVTAMASGFLLKMSREKADEATKEVLREGKALKRKFKERVSEEES